MIGKSKCSDRDSPLSLTTLSTATLGYDGDVMVRGKMVVGIVIIVMIQ